MNCLWLSEIPQLYTISLNPQIVITLQDISFQDYDGLITTSVRGLPTNGASVPSYAQFIFPPFSPEYLRSVIQHDGEYALHSLNAISLTRLQVDKKLHRSLNCENFEYADLWYNCVHDFGKSHWDSPATQDEIDWYAAVQQGDDALDAWIQSFINSKVNNETSK